MSGAEDATGAAPMEDLIADSLRDIHRIVTRFPRSSAPWDDLARALGLAGFEAMARQCQRVAVLLAPDDAWSWTGSARLIEDRLPIERPSRERLLEGIEGCRIAEILDPRTSRKEIVDSLTRSLPPR